MTLNFSGGIPNLNNETGQRKAIRLLAERTLQIADEVNGMGGGGGGGAPEDAQYLVGAASGDLTAERVVTDTPTVAWDLATGGQAKANIPDDAVTYAKLQNVSAADKLLGRSTAGAGNVEEIDCTAAGRALLDDANAAAQRATLGLGNLATANLADLGDLASLDTVDTGQIADDAVTYAKMQNVSATDKVLGRSTAGAGNVEEITCTAAGRALIDDATAGDQRTTLGLGSAATHPASDFADAVHTHAEADVTGLVADLAAKAPLASPALTGVPTAPTAASGTNTTQIATTAYVHGEVVAASGGIVSPAALTDLTDLVAWYSADNPNNTIPTANDGLITIFADKSGNGRDFTPGSGSIIKQYAQLAGLPVASFVGAMTANSQKTLPLKGALTFFAVLKITSTAAYQNLFAPGTTPADPADLHLYWDQPTNKWQIDGRVTPTANVSGRWMTLVVHYYNVSTTMNMKLRENGASVQVQVASTVAAHPIPGTSGVPVNYDIRMFYNGGFAFTSQIAEWGFYAATRDGSEATLEKYLRAKYSTW